MASFRVSVFYIILAVLIVFSSAAIMSFNETVDKTRCCYSEIGERIGDVLSESKNYIALLTPLPVMTAYIYVLWPFVEFFFFLTIGAVLWILDYGFGIDLLVSSDSHSNPRVSPGYIN